MFHVIGLDTAVSLASQAGQLELNVMMPIIAHDLFEMMHVIIGAVKAFTDRCVAGIKVNRPKAEGWLARNTIVVTALNPIIGYSVGAALVKEALSRDLTVQEVALEKSAQGQLKHKETGQLLTEAEIKSIFSDMRKFTDGGLVGGGGGG
ncbi:MAG: aspartate ammonia-lyase, partial [Anaerolinea sp.]|nr:aspartate ammonia-lyase [Anaerolinea sp.]